MHRARFCTDEQKKKETINPPLKSQTEQTVKSHAVHLYRMLRGVVERFEDLGHLPSGPEVHPEAGHGTARSQADHTAELKSRRYFSVA